MIDNPPCQYGMLSREEYRAGIRRIMCVRPSTIVVEMQSASGGTYAVYLCDEHAPYFQAINRNVKAAGRIGELVHTGGGVMVYHVRGDNGVSVGIDFGSIVVYRDDVEDESFEPHWITETESESIADVVSFALNMLTIAENK